MARSTDPRDRRSARPTRRSEAEPLQTCYALPMPKKVKERRPGRGEGRVAGRTRISSKHQVTIPVRAFRDAGLREGDVVQVEVQGTGRILLTRFDDLIDRYAGALSTGGELGRAVRAVRAEWE